MAKAKTVATARVVKPIGDRVSIMVTPPPAETVTPGGIVVPEKAHLSDLPLIGTVTAIGPKVVQAKIGDQVLYSAYAQSVKLDDTEFVLVHEEDILAILQ